ncbi:hypothetical protein CALCODRAFT_510354 [Calocera cornea HHB12733]|uniref:F-box domain-containing protein n=1 Tax=Calocera cornea HHB12733 TaxID=1353952 RepID=A0A165EJY6_9BASI|nr:hypothetical protein CALCODRAFT_510354 [Calocera cornea HHB12733]
MSHDATTETMISSSPSTAIINDEELIEWELERTEFLLDEGEWMGLLGDMKNAFEDRGDGDDGASAARLVYQRLRTYRHVDLAFNAYHGTSLLSGYKHMLSTSLSSEGAVFSNVERIKFHAEVPEAMDVLLDILRRSKPISITVSVEPQTGIMDTRWSNGAIALLQRLMGLAPTIEELHLRGLNELSHIVQAGLHLLLQRARQLHKLSLESAVLSVPVMLGVASLQALTDLRITWGDEWKALPKLLHSASLSGLPYPMLSKLRVEGHLPMVLSTLAAIKQNIKELHIRCAYTIQDTYARRQLAIGIGEAYGHETPAGRLKENDNEGLELLHIVIGMPVKVNNISISWSKDLQYLNWCWRLKSLSIELEDCHFEDLNIRSITVWLVDIPDLKRLSVLWDGGSSGNWLTVDCVQALTEGCRNLTRIDLSRIDFTTGVTKAKDWRLDVGVEVWLTEARVRSTMETGSILLLTPLDRLVFHSTNRTLEEHLALATLDAEATKSYWKADAAKRGHEANQAIGRL